MNRRRSTRRELAPATQGGRNIALGGILAAVVLCAAAVAYNPLLKSYYLSRVRIGDAKAAVSLADWGGSAVVPLREIVLSGPEKPRRAAARGLAATAKRTNGDYVLPEMRQLLSNSDPSVRAAAAWALGRSGVGRCIAALETVRNDPERAVRISAVRSLSSVADVRGLEFLLNAIEDEEPDVYQPAAEAVRKLSSKVKGAEKPLLRALRKKLPRVRTTAAGALVGFASRIDSGAVLDLLGDASPAVRTSAVRILVRIGDERARRGIAETLRDEASQVRIEAIDACARLQSTLAAPEVARMLREDPDEDVRSAAAAALAVLATEKELPALARSLADASEDKDVRLTGGRALTALGRLERVARYRAMGTLLAALDEADGEVRRAAREAMTALSGRGLKLDRRGWRSWVERKRVEARRLVEVERKVKMAEELASERGRMLEAAKVVEECVSILGELILSADPEDRPYFERLQRRVSGRRYHLLKFAPGGDR